MIEFFRDVLDGPLYIIAAIISVILIMAIVGFIMERLKLAKDEQLKVAHVSRDIVTPIEPVQVEASNSEEPSLTIENNSLANAVEQATILNNVEPDVHQVVQNNIPINNNEIVNDQEIPVPTQDTNEGLYVKPQVIVFEDPDAKETE